MKIAVITPTYNRRKLLETLYKSLLKQTIFEFVWIVVNDGSTDETDKYMRELCDSENPFEIRYVYKDNEGKAVAVDVGLDKAMDSDFAIIIDDDEMLYSNAIEVMAPYVDKYKNTDCGGMEFLRDDKYGKPIGNYVKDDFFMSIQMRKRRNLYIDGYTGYFIKALGDLRSPHFIGERYVGPGVLQCMVSNRNQLLWPNKSIGTTEYLEDGLTKQGRPLRLKNPKGMIYYSVLMQHPDSGAFLRFAYSALGYAYWRFSRVEKNALLAENINVNSFNRLSFLVGMIIACYWKIRYHI